MHPDIAFTGITIHDGGEPGRGTARFEMTVPHGMWSMTGRGAS